METRTGDAKVLYDTARAAWIAKCDKEGIIVRIEEGYPFKVRYTVNAPLSLLDAQTGELAAPQIIVITDTETKVRTVANKEIEASALKKMISTAQELAIMYFTKCTEMLFENRTEPEAQDGNDLK